MSNILCATLRLGKTSVEDIKMISRHAAGAISPTMDISVVCTQVPQEFAVGTYVFLWLGSDNSKGMPTEWKQGFKAVGRVKGIERGEKYNDESETEVEIGYVFSEAINRLDILREAPESYYWCSSMPVIGLDDHSNQTIRMIDEETERSVLKAFFRALNSVRKEFHDDIIGIYPDFKSMFDYTVPNPKNDSGKAYGSDVNEYQRAAKDMQEYVLETGYEIPFEKAEVKDAYDEFMARFSPEKLAGLTDEEVLDAIFYTSGDNHNALCYWLEKNPDCGKYFGGIEGGSAYKFGLFQRQGSGEWTTGSPRKPQILDADEALVLGKRIRDALVKGVEIIQRATLETLDDYEKLDDDLKDGMGEAYYAWVWIHKYLAIVCPDKLSCFHSQDWQRHVLYSLKIKPSEKLYARSGQLAMIENYAGWNYCEFISAFRDRFGSIKQFIRIGTSDRSRSYADEWRNKSVIGIGWPAVGSLEKYAAGDGLDREAIASELKINYYSTDARTASRKAGELIRFYYSDSNTVFVAMAGEQPLALVDNIGKYFYDDSSDMPNRKPGKWHYCFGAGDALPSKSEGKQTSCYQLTDVDNLMYLYEKYYYGSDGAVDDSGDGSVSAVVETNYRAKFCRWMRLQVKPETDSNPGQPYTENSISQYVSNIANTPCPSMPGHSLFATNDIDTVKGCISILDSSERKNNTQRSAVKKYLQFLEDMQLEEGGEEMPEEIMVGNDFIAPEYSTGFESDYERNRIVFGAPGTGKSFKLKQEAEELIGCAVGNMERVTFHTDYSYSQFVGAYKPVSDAAGKIRYDFVPGPFMRVYVNAIRNCQQRIRIYRLIEQAEVMHMFPTNPNPSNEEEKWDLFEEITEVGQTETFRAAKDTQIGDMALIYVAKTKPGYDNGIYAIGTIVSKQDEDVAVIRFDYVSYYYPIIAYETLREYGPNIRSNGRVSEEIMQLVKETELPGNPYLLVIEEINRAKVAAVFGDVFQLLDRDENGVSEYGIHTSEDVRRYLASQLKGKVADWTEIKLPDNMFIWASMNSADQGVFPMDTAFKRRWDFEYLGINENEEEIRGTVMLGTSVIQEVEWNLLRRAINDKLAKEYKVNEDKLMGPFFLSKRVLQTVSEEDDTIADTDRFMETFKSKVIMYLYEDAAKQYKHKLFAGCEDTTKYSAVCDSFDEIGIQIFGEDFEDLYYNPQKG